MRYLIFAGFLFLEMLASAQQTLPDRNIEVKFAIGDTLWFWKCPNEGKQFNYIDVYTKTRFLDTTAFHDSLGVDFYDWFFRSGGDLDGQRLSCFYVNEPCIIVSARMFKDKDTGSDKMIVFAWIDKARKKVAWIEIQPAIEEGEISLGHP